MNKTLRNTVTLGLSITLAFLVNAQAATFVVNTTADTLDATPGDGICADSTSACSLRAAIGEANALAGDDTITLPGGTYTITIAGTGDNVNLNGDFDINSPITINGAGSGTTFIESNASANTAAERVIHLNLGATTVALNDVTIRNGNTAINSSGSGVRIEGATTNLTLNRVIVTSNRSAGGGGGISLLTAGANLTINNSTISNNNAGSNVAASGSTGAGILIGGGAPTVVNINNSVISGNAINSAVASTFGGGISAQGIGATLTLTRCTVSGNSSTSTLSTGFGFAGGIYNQQATVTLNNSALTGNTANNFHGGIRTLSSTAVATTNINDSTVSNNIATLDGQGAGVTNITAAGFSSITNINRSTISGNMAMGTASVAGGIENFNGASATAPATVNVTNSTITGNSAADAGGIYNDGATATVNLDYSTVTMNSAVTSGGGILQDATAGGVTNLRNSIVANNTAPTGPDILGTITSQNYNHIKDITGGTFTPMPNDVTGTDPLLGPLANNGGPTQTELPAAGSPVVNTIPNGTNGCGTTVTVDQRGFFRPRETGCEKGSVEVQPTPPPLPAQVVSRKSHAGTPYDIVLPLTGNVGIEDRTGGATGDYQIVFNFPGVVTFNTAAVTSGVGTVSSTSGGGTTDITVNLTGVTNAQRLTVTLFGVNNGTSSGDVSVQLGVLVGDSNGDGSVNGGDAIQVRGRSGQPLTITNFRSDVNFDGTINTGDSIAVRTRSGTALPPP